MKFADFIENHSFKGGGKKDSYRNGNHPVFLCWYFIMIERTYPTSVPSFPRCNLKWSWKNDLKEELENSNFSLFFFDMFVIGSVLLGVG